MKRSFAAALALALTTAFAVPALAHGEKLSFPVKADAFKQHVDARVVKSREHLEAMIQKRSLNAEQAKELRAKFEAGAAAVTAETAKATADGTVTEDEAKAVRQVARQLHAGGHGHHCEGKEGHAKKS